MRRSLLTAALAESAFARAAGAEYGGQQPDAAGQGEQEAIGQKLAADAGARGAEHLAGL
jgi:hypothetical protein